MLHHRFQTDLKGVDAGVQASTPCTSRQRPARRGRRKVVPIVALFVNTIVCRRLQVAAGCMQDAAGCMQAACSLHAACIRSYAGGCRLQQAACRMQQAACRLHAACMQPACISSGALAISALQTIFIPFPAGGFSPDTASSIYPKVQTWPQFNSI